MSDKKQMQKIVVGVGRSDQNKAGVLIPMDATVVDVSIDRAFEHGTVTYFTREVVEVDEA